MNVDFGKTAHEYERYRSGLPERLFDELKSLGIGTVEQRVLDLGTGSGRVARAFASRGCSVVGVDTSEEMIAQAQQLNQNKRIDYQVGNAERLRFDEASFDLVAAGESWHWFKKPKALREVRHVLAPDGWLVIISYDWVPLPENVVDATEELIETYNPELARRGGTGVHPEWLRDVRCAGFRDIRTLSFDVMVPHTHESWRGRVRSSAAVQASMDAGGVGRFDERLRSVLAERFSGEELQVPHCCWALLARAPRG